MNDTKWYRKLGSALLVILLFPLFVLVLLTVIPILLVESPKQKKAYRASHYYAAFREKFVLGLTNSPEYRFYNHAVDRGLPMEYRRAGGEGGTDSFVYDETLYLFPNFEQMALNEEGTGWQLDFDGDWEDFDTAAPKLMDGVENPWGLPIKILVERSMISAYDLGKTTPPPTVFVTWSYEDAFENEDAPLKMKAPQNAGELLEMMRQTPDLCGEFCLTEDGEGIEWYLREDIKIDISINPQDCFIGVSRKPAGKSGRNMTHWHPTEFEIYQTVCRIGTRGHVLVIRTTATSGAVLYAGDKARCPYPPKHTNLFSRYDYIEAS